MGSGENIGTQVLSGHCVVSGALDKGPPLSVQQNLSLDPIRDGLLANGGMPNRSNAVSESLLAPSDLNGAVKRCNVRFIHEHKGYTRILVDVNKNNCLPADKGACTVLTMPITKRKVTPPPAQLRVKGARPKKSQETGADGLTLTQRLHSLMSSQEPPIGQTELARMCSEYFATFVPETQDKVKQQHIFNLLRGQDTAEFLPLVAAVLDVNELWLQYGIGPKERSKKV
jgi:hypothetical protein